MFSTPLFVYFDDQFYALAAFYKITLENNDLGKMSKIIIVVSLNIQSV